MKINILIVDDELNIRRFLGDALKNRDHVVETVGSAEEALELLGAKSFDLIILDELGYVPFSKAGAELLFDTISRAYERTSLIITTNLPFEEWTEVLGSQRLTGALLDRLTHRVHIIEANGESFRLKDSKRRLKLNPKSNKK